MALEITGVVLSSISVVIQAYERVAPRISDYRGFNRNINAHVASISAQNLRFRFNAVLLQSAIEENRNTFEWWLAQTIVSGLHHCMKLLQAIVSSLDVLEHDILPLANQVPKKHPESSTKQEIPFTRISKSLEVSTNSLVQGRMCMGQREAVNKTTDSSSRSRVSGGWRVNLNKLAYAILGKDRSLLDKIGQLRRLNQDFSDISNKLIVNIYNIARVYESKAADPSLNKDFTRRRRAVDNNTIEKYRQIRVASHKLYDTVADNWPCPNHQNHSVSVTFVEGNDDRDTTRFDIALCVGKSRTVASSSHMEHPEHPNTLWLEIEHLHEASTFTNNSTNPGSVSRAVGFASELLDDITSSISNHLDNLTATGKLSGISEQRSDIGQGKGMCTDTIRKSPSEQITDLVSVSDFCHHFGSRDQANASGRECLGSLGGQHVQRFYLQPRERRYRGDMRSLASLITWVRNQRYSQIVDESLAHKLASTLALAVLHFHNTPWLSQEWCSRDLQFFNLDGFSESAKLTPVHPSNPRLQLELETHSARQGTTKSFPSAQNDLPFQFGVVLLELGLSKTWETLKAESYTAFRLSQSRQNDYHIAREWWMKLKALERVGMKYLQLTWRCIAWDFHHGEDEDEHLTEGDQILFFSGLAKEMQKSSDGWMNITQKFSEKEEERG
ncbi:hypothetical protein QBC44DRAFT_390757 [Cladorrhinum sp. PSN332]|nr:hypothetical protein QBC44DRAFT_390757 [Cladorrhinum sp. PSN332]